MDLLDTKSIASLDNRSQSSGNQMQYGTNCKDNVKVVIRVRPLNEREKGNGGHKKCVTVENDSTIFIESKPDFKYFNFDFVGDENIEQEVIFNSIAKPIADGCLEGYNGSIFAYGQTGAGKTFTIQGPSIVVNGEEHIYGSFKDDENKVNHDKRGIMQRSFEYIFDCIDKQRQIVENSPEYSQFDFLIRCSYLEIYNEQIMDLLDPNSINLHIREDIKKGVYVEGLQEEVVLNAQDMIGIIQTGAKNRHVGSTSMNKESSRSHSVLTTIIETKSMRDGGVWNIKTSRFHIIDLAGSERSKYTNAVGERLKEAGMINKSLSALGNVINSLVDISEGKSRHVHYRDSKLTFLLRDSLGGNSKTVIIANISPSSICFGETLSTLKFAQRAKLIRNKAIINEDSSGTIQLLKSEISRLKKELAENEKMYKNIDISNPNGQCSLCKALIGSEINQEEEDELLINNISVCEDLDSTVLNTTHQSPLNEVLKQKFKNQKEDLSKMRKRVVHLEGLLTANLDSLASQQKFYDNEILKNQQQNKKLQQAVESYEKQCARDKMIIKFREERISKLEQNQPVTKDDQQKQITDLKKEVQQWKEAAEHNSQAAKLFAEKADLQNKLDQLKNEYKQSPDSLSAQMRTLTELNESLNQYLKLYCEESKKEVENELSKVKLDYAEKIEQLNEKIAEIKEKEFEIKDKYEKQVQDYNDMVGNYKLQVERMLQDHQKDKQDLDKANKEHVEQIKNEIAQINDNKSEQEKEISILRIQVIEKDQELSKERDAKIDAEKQYQLKYADYQTEIAELIRKLKDIEELNLKIEAKLKQSLEHFEQNLENERKQSQQYLKEREEYWEEQSRQLQRKILEESSEKHMLEEQCQQCNDKIRSLEQENETIQQSLMYKEEQIQEIQSSIHEKDCLISKITNEQQELKDKLELDNGEHNENIQQLQSQLESHLLEKEQLQAKLDSAIADKKDLQIALNDIKQEIQDIITSRDELNQQIETHLQKIESQSSRISTLEQDVEQKLEIISNLQNSIQDLNESSERQNQLAQNQIEQVVKEKEAAIEQEKIMKQEINHLRSELEQMLDQNIERVTQIQQQFQQEIERTTQEYEERLTSLAMNSDRKMNDQSQEIQTLNEEKQQLKEELAIRMKEFSRALEELQSEIQQKDQVIEATQIKAQSLIETIHNIEQEKKEEIQQVQTSQNTLVQVIQEQLKQKIQEYESQIQKMEQKVEEERQLAQQQVSQTELKLQEQKEQIIHEKEQTLTYIETNHLAYVKQIEINYLNQIEVLKQEKNNIIQEAELKVQQITIGLNQQIQEQQEKFDQQSENHLQEITRLQQQLEDVQIQKEESIKQLIIEVEEGKKTYQELLSQNLEEKQKELEQQIQVLIESHQVYIEQINVEAELQKQEILAFNTKQIEAKEAELVQAKEQKEEILVKYQTQLEETKQQMDVRVHQEQEKLQDTVKTLEAKLQIIEVENDTLQAQVIEANKNLQEEEEKAYKFTCQVQDLISQKAKIQEMLQQTLSDNQIISRQIDTSLSQNDALQKETQSLQSDIQRNLQIINERNEKIQNLIENISQLQNQISDNRTIIQSLEQQLNSASHKQSQCEKEQQNEIQNLRQNLTTLEQRNKDLSDQISMIHIEKEQDMQALTSQIIDRDNHSLQYQERIQKQQALIDQLHLNHNQSDQQTQLLQQDIKKQKLLLEDTVNSLNREHNQQIVLMEQESQAKINAVKQEYEGYKNHAKDLNHQIAKLRQDNEDQNQMLKSSKDTISKMVQKENELMKELEKNINEFKDKHEKSKKRLEESRDQQKQLRSEWEKQRKENENLKDLIKLKDRQIEDQQNADERDKQALEQMMKENKDLRNSLTKREFEMKDLIRTMKFLSDEKQRLEKEIEKLNRENDMLVGNKNPNYKIQYHVKIKEDNNKLREENTRLQEELRRKLETISKLQKSLQNNTEMSMMMDTSQMPSTQRQDSDQLLIMREDLKKMRKDNMTYQETINRLVDHILSQPGLFKIIGLTEETNEKLMQYNGPTKVKKCMEIISMLSNHVSTKERELKDLEREIKKYECRIEILEKEKVICKQQIEIMSNPGMVMGQGSFIQNSSAMYQKRSPIGNPSQNSEFMSIQNSSDQQNQYKQPSRIHVDGFLDEKQNSEYMAHAKQSPSPIYNIRQQKEKENVNVKRDLFGSQNRAGSGRRTTYLGNGQQQNIQK